MRKIVILDDGTEMVHNGILITGSSPEIVEEYELTEVEFEKAKKDKKYLAKLTKEKKELSIKATTLVNKNGK